MNLPPSLHRSPAARVVLAVCVVNLAMALPSRAAMDTWTGGGAPDGNWQNPANWGGTAPVAGDFLIFDTSNQTAATNNFANGTVFGTLAFNPGAGPFTLWPVSGGDGSGLILTNSLEDSGDNLFGGCITNQSPSAETLALPLTLSAGNHIITTAGGAGALGFNGAFGRNVDATVQYYVSGGSVNYTGAGLGTVNGIIGGYATIGLGVNAGDWATLDGSQNVVAYSGYTTKGGGSNMGLSNSGANAANNIKINSQSGTANTLNSSTAGTYDINTLVWNIGGSNPGGNQTLTISSSQVLRLGANGAIMNVHSASRQLNVGSGSTSSSGITAGGAANTAGELSLYSVPLSDGNARLNINAPILDNGSGKISVNAYGGMTLAQPGSFSGGLYLNSCYIWDNTLNAVGSGPVWIYPGSELILNFGSGKTFTNSIYVGGYGGHDPLALRDNTGNTTLSGTLTLLSTATLAGSGSTTTLNGLVTGPGGLYVVTSYGNASLHLGESAPNTYAGDTTIDAAGIGNDTEHSITVWVNNSGHNNIMPSGPGSGNLILNSGASHLAQFDIGGSTQTINGLSSTGTTLNTSVTSNPGGGTLVVGANDASSEFDGVIGTTQGSGTANINITKVGTGTLTLGGANTYTGNTTISNGVLALGPAGSIPTSAHLAVNSTATFDVSQTSFTLGAGQTLTGNGVVNGSVNTAATSLISPGFGPGTLTFQNDLTLNTGATCLFELSATTNGANDLIVVGGTVNLAGATIQISAPTLEVGRYKLLTYAVGETGTAAANLVLSYVPSGVSVALDDSVPGEIDLLVSASVPETLIWAGDNVANVWDVNNTPNWSNNGVGSFVFTNGAFVVFDDTGSKSPAVNLSAPVQPLSLLVSNNSGTYTFSGAGGGSISGGTPLLKTGAGTLVLTEYGDSFTGGINVNNGTVVLDSDSSGVSGGTTIAGAGVVQLGNNDANGVLPSGALTDNGALVFNRNDAALMVGTVIAGSGTVANNGSGTVTLGAANTFSGGLTVNQGVLQVASTGGGSTPLGSGPATINPGATLVGLAGDAFGYHGGAAPAVINIGGTVTDDGSSSYRITLPNLTFAGGALANAVGNSGDGSGHYSLFGDGTGCTVTTLPTNTTALISANVSFQEPATFNVAAGSVTGGPTPGVDLLIASAIKPFGAQPMSKTGAGVLAVDTDSPSYSGGVTISAGTLQVGTPSDASGMSTPLGTGAVTLKATLDDASDQQVTIPNVISGTGTLVKNGNDFLLLTGNNVNWTGTVSVASGTVQFGAVNAFGAGTNTPITVASGATLDFNGIGGHTNAATAAGSGVGGNGAIVNGGADAFPALSYLTLSGDLTVGGIGRWDLRSAGGTTGDPAAAGLMCAGGQPYNLTKIGANFIGLVSVTVDTNLANIDLQGGTLDIEGNTTGLGNPTNTLTAETGVTLFFYQPTNTLNKVFVMKDGSGFQNSSGATVISGPVTLSTNLSGGPGTINFDVGGTSLSVNNVLSGPGNLNKVNSGSALLLAAANTYTGNTVVNAGSLGLVGNGSIATSPNIVLNNASLDATLRSDQTWTLASGQTLTGTNSGVLGSLFAAPGSTLVPGGTNNISTLTVSTNVTLAGTLLMDIDKSGATSDLLAAGPSGHLTYGGTLVLNSLSAPLAGGDSFKLFNAGSYSGSFAAILPPTPGAGLLWDTNSLITSGRLNVAPTTALNSTNLTAMVSGNQLILSWPTDHTGWHLQVQTNTPGGLGNNWVTIPGTDLGDSYTNTLDPAVGSVFYRMVYP